ncbi:STAS domain-containing protein [Saccharopolyspora sp. HNM0983]|uniref:STAS domain-containing protein n=1 Tax=Saccharopolyspora montiporae TaxID=2781240 RepID=A0A929BD30_9PSEU|nr:STAS domain-containing protein [Saccharopolyspora sp. HNM0983]MBE9376621.1 STAS domain-containing protein [Saccharopolyspora sp. HNM0983]
MTSDRISGAPPGREAARLGLRASRPSSGTVLITVTGELDAATVPHLEERIDAELGAPARTVVLDLTAVPFLAVAALEMLHRAQLRAGTRGIGLRVVIAGAEPLRALRHAGLDALRRPDVTDALDAASG